MVGVRKLTTSSFQCNFNADSWGHVSVWFTNHFQLQNTTKHIRQITKIEQVFHTKVKHNGHKFNIGFLKLLWRLSLATLRKILSYNSVHWPHFRHRSWCCQYSSWSLSAWWSPWSTWSMTWTVRCFLTYAFFLYIQGVP